MANNLQGVLRLCNSIIGFLERHPSLHRLVLGLARKHDSLMGYRKYGLLRDDLINDENDIVVAALDRLSDKEMFDRTFRLRRAMQLHLTHDELPKEEWSSSEEKSYSWPHIEAICKERDERLGFDSLQPKLGLFSRQK